MYAYECWFRSYHGTSSHSNCQGSPGANTWPQTCLWSNQIASTLLPLVDFNKEVFLQNDCSTIGSHDGVYVPVDCHNDTCPSMSHQSGKWPYCKEDLHFWGTHCRLEDDCFRTLDSPHGRKMFDQTFHAILYRCAQYLSCQLLTSFNRKVETYWIIRRAEAPKKQKEGDKTKKNMVFLPASMSYDLASVVKSFPVFLKNPTRMSHSFQPPCSVWKGCHEDPRVPNPGNRNVFRLWTMLHGNISEYQSTSKYMFCGCPVLFKVAEETIRHVLKYLMPLEDELRMSPKWMFHWTCPQPHWILSQWATGAWGQALYQPMNPPFLRCMTVSRTLKSGVKDKFYLCLFWKILLN